MTHLSGNWMMVGKHNFVVGSNVTNFFAIGDFMKQDDFFAIGHFKSNGDFAIDAKLYSSSGDLIASIKDNQVDIKGEKFQQVNTIEKDNFHALEVIDTNGIQVLYVEMTEKKPIVEITGRLYDKTHREIATGTKNDLVVHNGKMVLGASKSGIPRQKSQFSSFANAPFLTIVCWFKELLLQPLPSVSLALRVAPLSLHIG